MVPLPRMCRDLGEQNDTTISGFHPSDWSLVVRQLDLERQWLAVVMPRWKSLQSHLLSAGSASLACSLGQSSIKRSFWPIGSC